MVHNNSTQTSITIEACDDVREPRVCNVTLGPAETKDLKAKTAPSADIKIPVPTHTIEKVTYRNKVLRVAWHPQLNAVVVAGLYKLYLYQAKHDPPAQQ